MDDDEIERLNKWAYLALRGFNSANEGAQALALLFRSDAPIQPEVRRQIAQALDPIGKHVSNVRLCLTNLDEGSQVRKYRTQRKAIEIGETYLRKTAAGMKPADAMEDTKKEFGITKEKTEKAVTFTKKQREKISAWTSLSEEEREDIIKNNPVFQAAEADRERLSKGRA